MRSCAMQFLKPENEPWVFFCPLRRSKQSQAVPFLLFSELELFYSDFVQNLHFLSCFSSRFWLTLRYLG